MEYTGILNRRLKKAGRDFVRSQSAARAALLEAGIEEILQEAEGTGTFFPWTKACELLLERDGKREEMLLCAVWGQEAAGAPVSISEFRRLYMELFGEEPDSVQSLPVWYYPADGQIRLSPVLTGWLEGRAPKLPDGTALRIPKEETAYGLGEILTDAGAVFRAADGGAGPLILCVAGEPGSGRTFCMEQICREQGMTLLLADGDVFEGTERELNACVLCTMLYDAFFCIRLGQRRRDGLMEELEDCFSFFGVVRDSDRELSERPSAPVVTRTLERPDGRSKEEIAKALLGELLEKLPEGTKRSQITGRQLPAGDYIRYVRAVRAELLAGTAGETLLLPQPAGARLNLLPATRTFGELKLPESQYGQLRQICRMIGARERVLEERGFGRRFSYGNGISVLFYGAPGTGKTMAAQVMASELGMPLYRVDLSQLISKYIGETQKNIGRIFDEAARCDCILLFDEADAIFARRSEVSDAQDRYSNAETAYLLQRIEQYGGVCVLATNLLQNFDEAFRRRISYMVHFPMPDGRLREELWRDIFPADARLEPGADFRMLAEAFELSGASIKNAAFHAALLAESEGRPVAMGHILDGVRNEYGKQGRNLSPSQRELLEAFAAGGSHTGTKGGLA
ncbi:MAG: AAA family ATPase [Eubacteriales bacterium]|nr:AAA family ATPase [Eubacteriales bacterium]